jgi:hypothetical protein
MLVMGSDKSAHDVAMAEYIHSPTLGKDSEQYLVSVESWTRHCNDHHTSQAYSR